MGIILGIIIYQLYWKHNLRRILHIRDDIELSSHENKTVDDENDQVESETENTQLNRLPLLEYQNSHGTLTYLSLMSYS